MSKIIDIKYVSGRRQEAIDYEGKVPTETTEPLIKLARFEYAMWVRESPSYHTDEIEVWAQRTEFKDLFKQPLIPSSHKKTLISRLNAAGIEVPEGYLKSIPPEISIENKIVTMLKDGWELYGEIKKIPDSKHWLQTMVKYQQKVTCEHCGKIFDSHDIMASSHLVDSADNSKKVCPATVSLF